MLKDILMLLLERKPRTKSFKSSWRPSRLNMLWETTVPLTTL
jgi:hypothetical protein